MAIVRWDPLRDLVMLQDRMNRLFEDSLARTRGEGRREGQEGLVTGLWTPPVDIYETDDAIVMKAELPGIDRKDIQLEVRDGVLTLKGERRFEKEVKQENYHRIERAYGAFARSFTLPNTVQPDKVKARFKDGVLEVTLPKAEETRSRQIQVEMA